MTAAVAEGVLADAAAVARGGGLAIMPLKGVLFQRMVYASPSERPLTDVDVLVRPADEPRFVAGLTARGYRERTAGDPRGQRALVAPSGFEVDVHTRLFPPGRFRMEEEGVWSRASVDGAWLPDPVHIMAPLDMVAHVVGKFTTDHLDPRAPQAFQDLERVGDRFRLDPTEVARHLENLGLGRAARYVLGFGRAQGLPFAASVLARLEPDPFGALVARAARATVPRLPHRHRAGAVAAHLLNASFRDGAASALAAFRRR